MARLLVSEKRLQIAGLARLGRSVGRSRLLLGLHLGLDQAARRGSPHGQEREHEADNEEGPAQPFGRAVQERHRLPAAHHLHAGPGAAETRGQTPALAGLEQDGDDEGEAVDQEQDEQGRVHSSL